MVQPGVEHEHVKNVQLLHQRNKLFRLNDGPFRVLHVVAFAAYTYCVLTYTPPEQPATVSTDFDEPIIEAQEIDILDSVVAPDEFVDAPTDAPEVYEMWEPETPQDYVQVAWAILIIFHVLINLFCIWTVRVKKFCQFSRTRSIDTADHILCIPDKNHGNPDIVPLGKRKIKIPSSGDIVRPADGFAVVTSYILPMNGMPICFAGGSHRV